MNPVEHDPLLKFIDYARSALSPEPEEYPDPNPNGSETARPSWNWIASRILKTCSAYSSGVTAAILLSELSQAWHEQSRDRPTRKMPECVRELRKKHKRRKLPSSVTIDSIYEKNFLSLNSVLEAVIVDVYVLPGTKIYMLSLGDFWSSNTIDLYLHHRYYDLINPTNGILSKGRQIFLTGCYLRSAVRGSHGPRLLPTEYLVVLLDEDDDADAMLLAAQFCSDTFSSISLDAFNKYVSYSLYARIVHIGPLEVLGTLQRKQITLVDDDGTKLQFVLWGEQVVMTNILSLGSMIALEKPYVASSNITGETSAEVSLEFGSATQLFLIPVVQRKEQVCIALTPNRYQGSRLQTTIDPSQSTQVSQVSLPCDSHGSIDFSNYPFQSFVSDLRDKMTGVSLYGVVTCIIKERCATEAVFSLKIEDTSGAIWTRLHFVNHWSLGKLSLGHIVYITGLTCSMKKRKGFQLNRCENNLEALWSENTGGASFFNLSSMPALLNSSCLHKLTKLSDLSSHSTCTQIVHIQLEMLQFHLNTRFSHAVCGHLITEQPTGVSECSFCNENCGDVVRTFHLKVTLADKSGKILAWCTGHTATEIVQISPNEFFELPEEEQVMYPSSLHNERFKVAIVNCKREGSGPGDALVLETEGTSWEITRALKCD